MNGTWLRIDLHPDCAPYWFDGADIHTGHLVVDDFAHWQQVLFQVRAGDTVVLTAPDGREMPALVTELHLDARAIQVLA